MSQELAQRGTFPPLPDLLSPQSLLRTPFSGQQSGFSYSVVFCKVLYMIAKFLQEIIFAPVLWNDVIVF